MGSQGILISHLIWKGFYEHESLCSVFGAHVEVSAVPCAAVEFRVGWEALRSTGSCASPTLLLHEGQFYSGCTGITGSFLKHGHLISLQLTDFNGVYSFNFYNGVR